MADYAVVPVKISMALIQHCYWCSSQYCNCFLSYCSLFCPTASELPFFPWSKCRIKMHCGAFLVAQWLRIRLPMQGTWVWALVREDPTCHGATKPMCHNYWARALEPASHNYWAHVLQLLKLVRLEPVLCNKKSHRNKKPMHCNEE